MKNYLHMKISFFNSFIYFIGFVMICGLFSYCTPAFRPGIGYSSYLESQDDDSDEDEDDEDEDDDDDEDDNDDDNDEDDNDDEDDEDTVSKTFPYEAVMDTMAFMGCDSISLTDFGGFHFKIGSFLNGGVRLREDFREKTVSAIKKYPKHNSKPFIAFTQDYTNIDNVYQFRIFERSFLEKYLDDFIQSGQNYTNLFQREYLSRAYIQDKSSGRRSSKAVANTLNSNHVILGFSDKENHIVINEDNRDRTPHGRAYTLNMREEHDNRYVINELSEKNLTTDKSQGEWACHHQFKIMRHEDNTYGEEPTCEDNDSDRDVYNLLRDLLGSKWNINTSKNCISPTRSRYHCYSLTGNKKYPNSRIFFSNDCDPQYVSEYCPHYLSVCIRSR